MWEKYLVQQDGFPFVFLRVLCGKEVLFEDRRH